MIQLFREVIAIFDTYIYTERSGGAFVAGYGKCKIESKDNPVFLFTTLRILRVKRGEASWRVGSRILNISRGDIVFVNNVEPRQFISVGDEPLEASIFAISPALLSKEGSLISLFYSGIDLPIIKTDSEVGRKTAAILDTAEVVADGGVVIPGVLSHLLLSAACLIQSAFDERVAECSVSSAMMVAKAISVIEERLSELSSVSQIASEVGLCREHFTVLFKQFIGISPAAYIRRARLERVINLLKREDMNVLDAALAAGFSSSSGFYRAFSAEFSTSPRALLK